MRGPNIWVGIGDYGADVLRHMEQRLPMLDLFQGASGAGRPVLILAPMDAPPAELPDAIGLAATDGSTSVSEAATRAILNRLPPGFGATSNERAHILVFAHERELFRLPDVTSPGFWLWNLAKALPFSSTILTVFVSAEASLASLSDPGRTARVAADIERLVDVLSAQGSARVTVLAPNAVAPDPSRPGDLPSPSRDALVMLFDLLTSLEDDPMGDPALAALLHGIFQSSVASFGIAAEALDFQQALQTGAEQLATDLLAELTHPGPSLLLPEGPHFVVSPPPVPLEVAQLQFRFRPRFLQSSADAIAMVTANEARIAAELPGWWAQQTRIDLSGAIPSREELSSQLFRAREWLDARVREWWEFERHSAAQIARALGHLKDAYRADSATASQFGAPSAAPDISSQVGRLRDALASRPDPAPVLVMVLAVGLAAAVLGYGTATWLGSRFGTFHWIDALPLRLVAAAACAGACTAEPILRWLYRPWARVRTARHGVDARLREALNTVRTFRTGLAENTVAVIKAEASLRFAADIARIEDRFRRVASITRQQLQQAQLVDSAVNAPPPNLFERLTATPGGAALSEAERASTAFRACYSPGGTLRPGGAARVDAAELPATILRYARDETLRPLIQPGAASFSLLGLNPQPLARPSWLPETLRSAFHAAGTRSLAPAGYAASPLALRRGDRSYLVNTIENLRPRQVLGETSNELSDPEEAGPVGSVRDLT